MAERIIRLPVGGMEIHLQRENTDEKSGGGSITSQLKEPGNDFYNAAIDGMESLILAHACAGIDVRSPAYIKGIETAIDAVANSIGQPDSLMLDGRTVQPHLDPPRG